MGCKFSATKERDVSPVTSVTEAEEAEATKQLSSSGLRMLVVGPPGCGKTAVCRRFLQKTFTADALPEEFCSGTRQIGINKHPLDITLIDADDLASRPASFNDVDAVVYVVSAEEEEPFTGVYRYLDGFYNDSDAARALLGRNALSGVSAASGFSFSDVGSLGAGLTGASSLDSSESRHSAVSHGSAEPREWMSGSGSRKPSLQLDTSRSRSRVGFGPLDKAPPLGVFVTKCDVLEGSSSTRRFVRLRAMAQNWASANRCKVTFVSSSSGAGINNGIANLIKQVWHRRNADSVEA